MYNFYLASGSARRKEILSDLGYLFQIIKPEVDEIFDDNKSLEQNLKEVVLRKANTAKEEIQNENYLILAADTIVYKEDRVLGKPSTDEEAIQMITSLMRSSHSVLTSYVLLSESKKIEKLSRCEVKFGQLSTEEIQYYVHKYKPHDKAGAYGIQEWIGMAGIEKIDGDFYTVMGLPAQKVYQDLTHEFGYYPVDFSGG